MMKIREITEHLERRFPLCLQEDFDNCGVQCGDVEQSITGALVCFELSETVIDEAIALQANLVLSHHPLMLKRGICRITPTDRVGKILCKALAHNIVVYSLHTNMDSAQGGGNDAFAERLGLSDVRVLVPHTGSCGEHAGLGRIGQLPETMDVPSFLNYVKEKMGIRTLRYYGDVKSTIRTVALCGGGGASFIQTAMSAGADAYVSGDIKYHDFLNTDKQMLVADIGHYESECFIKEIIYKEVVENFTTFATSISKMDNLEIFYL